MSAIVQQRRVEVGPRRLSGELALPQARQVCLVLLFHGREHGRSSLRNQRLAQILQRHNLGTLRVGLLPDSEPEAERIAHDAPALASRMVETLDWVREQPDLGESCVAVLGACVAGAAVLLAAGERRAAVDAAVSLGGHLDLLAPPLPVQAPVLLIVGGLDTYSLPSNRVVYQALGGRKRLELVPGASHRFEEPGTLETMAYTVADWLKQCKPVLH